MRADKKLSRNRKARKELVRWLKSENSGLEVIHPRAAGIDVSNGAHYVAARPDCDPQPVRTFECFTAVLNSSFPPPCNIRILRTHWLQRLPH